MPLNIIDTHAHLDMPEFDSDRETVIKRAVAAGVSYIITNGIDLESSRKAVHLSEKYPSVFATVGFHPQDAGKMRPGDVDELARLAEHPRVVAIGEIGLDYYREKAPRQIQQQVLNRQLALAVTMDLPVVIHARQAEPDIIGILENWVLTRKIDPGKIGVIHCFNGNHTIAQKYLEMGFHLGLDAYIGYPSSRMSDVIRSIPADRLLIETDCPFLPPQNYRGQRNEPSYLPLTLATLAEIRSEPPKKTARQTSENARFLFSKIIF